MLLGTLLTTTMIATGGYGAFSDNPLTSAFQDVIGENFPPELLNPFNAFMANLSAPQIPPVTDSESDRESPLDPVGAILSLFEKNTSITNSNNKTPFPIEATLVALASTQTEVVSIQNTSFTMTQAQIQTQTAMPTITLTSLPTMTQTTVPTLTSLPVYYYPPTATEKPEPTPTFTPTNTPVPAPTHLLLYSTFLSPGNLGSRSSLEGQCIQPWGYSSYHAFIGYSNIDSIANMPSNYGIPTNLPVQSLSNVIIATDWASLMDGNIDVTLNSAGVVSSTWWSGVEDEFGNFVDGTTLNCDGWTNSTSLFTGNFGVRNQTDATWIMSGTRDCSLAAAVVCVAY